MPAGVVERAQVTVACPGNDDLLRADLRNKKVARFRDLLRPADSNPVAVPDRLEFALVMIGIDIPAAGQGRMKYRSYLPSSSAAALSAIIRS